MKEACAPPERMRRGNSEEAAETRAGAAAGRAGPLLGVLCAALLYALACPPYELAGAAWLVPGMLLRATRGQRAGWALASGLLFALIFGYGMTSWAVSSSLTYFGLSRLYAWMFAAAVWLACGLPYAFLTAAYALTWRRVRPAARAPLAAWLWIAAEMLRASLFGGMPWELLGHTQFRQDWLIQVADLGGVYAVSFVVVLTSVATCDLLVDSWRGAVALRRAPGRLALPAVTLAATFAYGWVSLGIYDTVADRGEWRTVAVVQGNIPNSLRWKRAHFERSLETYAKLTAGLRAARPDFVVWPENAVDFYVEREPLLRARLAMVAREAGEGFVFGAPRLADRAGEVHNSAYLMSATGAIEGVYDKRKLVPFAEYDPLAWKSDDELAYAAGGTPQLLRAGRASIGAAICYEILFPSLIRDLVREGATLLFNISNDSWMDVGDGVAPRQHSSMAVFRAVESRRFLVRASSGGLSGFVSPLGEMFAGLPDAAAGTAVASVQLRSGLTPYVRGGDLWAIVGIAGTALSLLVTWRRA